MIQAMGYRWRIKEERGLPWVKVRSWGEREERDPREGGLDIARIPLFA